MKIEGFENDAGGIVKVHRHAVTNSLIISGEDDANTENPVLLTVDPYDAMDFAKLVTRIATEIESQLDDEDPE